MFIENIAIKDFRNIEETSAEFAPLTIIRGHNHQGKSSIAQAIQISLTTCADGTDGQGRGANDKIRSGAKKATIDLGLRGKSGKMPFAVTYGPGRTGRTVISENPPPFINWLKNNSDRLCCALDSDYFVRQKAEDQKSILASLVLPTSYDFPQEIRALVEKWLTPAWKWDDPPLMQISIAHQMAFDARRAAKAAVDAIHIPAMPPNPVHTAEEVNAKLATLRTKAAKLAKQPGANVEVGRWQEQLRQTEAQIAALENDASELRTSINDADSNILGPAALKVQQSVAGKRRVYDSYEDQAQELARQIEDQRNVEQIYRELLAEKKCPTCQQAISEEFINARIAEAKQRAAGAGEKQRDLMRQQKEMGNITEAERLIADHNRSSEQKASFTRELAEVVSNKADVQAKARTLQQQLQAVPEAPAEPNNSAELDAVHADMSKWEHALADAIGYETSVKQIRQLTERKQAESEKVAALEKLVAYFGKDGVKATLIQQNIDAFSESVNTVLAVWGYSAVLSIEPYSFDVTNSKGKTLPLKELSGSEKLMFGVALQTAIAHHARINTVLVDKADTFLGPERNRLYASLGGLIKNGVLEQAIVMVSDDRTEATKKEGVAFYAAQDGKLVRL